jgi:hypothetical protein
MSVKFLVAAILATLIFVFTPPAAHAFPLFNNQNNPSNACTGQAANSPTCEQASSQGSSAHNRLTGTGSIIQVAADIVALITGIAAVIMIVISALTMATSGGNTEAVTNSRRRLAAAIIGLVIVALAWTLTRFITDRLIK